MTEHQIPFQGGSYLKTCEGQEQAVLCNEDSASETDAEDVCIINEYASHAMSEEYDTCEGAHDMGVVSHPVDDTHTDTVQQQFNACKTQTSAGPKSAADKTCVIARILPPAAACQHPAGSTTAADAVPVVAAEDRTDRQSRGPSHDSRSPSRGSQATSQDGVEVVYMREGVFIRPNDTDKIQGRFSLICQDGVLFMAWLPYSHGELQEDGTFKKLHSAAQKADSKAETQVIRQRGCYAVHPLPLSEVKSIKRHTPSFGYHYIVIVLTDGLTLPPLYFANGGIKALLSALREAISDMHAMQHTLLVRCPDDPNAFLVNDICDPLHHSLGALELADVLLRGNFKGPSAGAIVPVAGTGVSHSVMWDGTDGRSTLRHMLEQFKQLARDTTSSFLAATAAATPGPSGATAELPCRSLEPPAWAAQSCPSLPHSPGSNAGGDAGLNAMEERRRSHGLASTNVGMFELIERQAQGAAGEARSRVRPPPISAEEWCTFLDDEGRVVNEQRLRECVFRRGVAPSVRRTAWKYLLGVVQPSATEQQQKAEAARMEQEYQKLLLQWESIGEAQAAKFQKWRERRNRVDKDVRRTDRSHPFFAESEEGNLKKLRRILLTYSMYNFDLGYCQGMSDLAAPLLVVMKDEAEAFWAFVALMQRMEANFHTDCTGMHAQLLALRKLLALVDPALHDFLEQKDCINCFFAYRWLLIHFKREFAFDEVLRLWDALWSHHLSRHFHLFVCLAVIEQQRRAIMQPHMDFDGLLKYCISLSGNINLDSVLRDAETLCTFAGTAGEACLQGVP